MTSKEHKNEEFIVKGRKLEFGEFYTSHMGYKFNCHEDFWRVTDSKYIDVSVLDTIQLSNLEQLDLRYALARLTAKRSNQTILSYLITLRELELVGFSAISADEVNILSPKLAYQHIKNLRALFKELVSFNHEYLMARNALTNFTKPQKKILPAVFDIEKGALNDFELCDLAEKMNRYSDLLISGNLNLKKHPNRTPLGTWTYFISMRLLLSFSRRPVQIAALKWKDVFLDKTQTGIKVKLRMPMGKQRDGFRESFESIGLVCSDSVSKEIIIYRKNFESTLRSSLKFQCSLEEMNNLILEMPVIPHRSLWELGSINKLRFFELVAGREDRFHCDSLNVGRLVRNLFRAVPFSPVSNRVPKERYYFGVNRLRHTTGSRMAAQGYSVIDIAAILGNTISAAKCYVDLTDEVRTSIDSSFSSIHILSESFSGKLTTTVSKGEVSIDDESLGRLGKSADVRVCLNCSQSRPIACYGCDYFRPLVGADHKKKLFDIESILADKAKNGININALSGLKRAIEHLKTTIYLCDQYKSKLETTEE